MKKIVALLTVAALVAFAAPALAANPFMDVPMNSWAYDAISQLSASGVVSGYPDGTFKGNQPMTRYEMASIVARALATVDMNKASKQDVEMLKKLVVEFKDELDALGVKVDKLDSRVAVMEENLGGWKIAGDFRFDYSDFDNPGTGVYSGLKEGKDSWNDQNNTLSRARFHFYKTINENVKFYGRLDSKNDGSDIWWKRYYIDVKLPYDMALRVGKLNWDWEEDLYWVSPPGSWQTDAVISAQDQVKGYEVKKDFSMGTAKFIVGRQDAEKSADEYLLYGADFELNFNEMFSMQLAYAARDYEDDKDTLAVWWVAPKVDFGNGIALKGAYYQEDLDQGFQNAVRGVNDDPSLWKAIVTVDQKLTGFSSFWIEYADIDQNFQMQDDAYDFVADTEGFEMDKALATSDVAVFQVMAAQRWNDKWDTWFRYATYDVDKDIAYEDADNYTIGVDYLYSDAVRFELLYDEVDSDNDAKDDHLINFRTAIYF